MIVVTGGAGFIGSAFVWQLNEMGIDDILIVDDLGDGRKWMNLRKRQFTDIVGIDEYIEQLNSFPKPDAIIHMGACSSTTETDADFLVKNNFHYTMKLWKLLC